jgi:integrase/recombinase XerD
VSQVRRIVCAAARNACLEQRISPHRMRHAHAGHTLDRSAPIHLVQATLGHDCFQMHSVDGGFTTA